MTMFEILSKAQAPTDFKRSEEYLFWKKNHHRLFEYERFSQLAKRSDCFGIIRSNIVLRILDNKSKIEEEARTKGEAKSLDSLPYLLWEGEKIYVPLFVPSAAYFYGNSSGRLSKKENETLSGENESDLIDPFDYYGKALYESGFVNLLPVLEQDGVSVMYDDNSRSLYFINGQGRLDAAISLFDKDLENPDFEDIASRAKIVSEAYFENSRERLVTALFEQKFISEKLLERLTK